MGVIAEGILRGCRGFFTPVSLGYPLSVFNKKLYSQTSPERTTGHGAGGIGVPPKGSTEGLFSFQLPDEVADQGASDIVPTREQLLPPPLGTLHVPEFLPVPLWMEYACQNPVELQVLVRIYNSLNTHDETHAVRAQVLAEVKRAQVKLLVDFHVVDRQQGFFPARLTGGGSHGKGGQ